MLLRLWLRLLLLLLLLRVVLWMLLLMLLLWRGLWELLLLGVVGVPWGIGLMVGVMRSSHTVQHGMTAKIARSKVNHCRHLGESATNRRGGAGNLILQNEVSLAFSGAGCSGTSIYQRRTYRRERMRWLVPSSHKYESR